MKEKIKTILEAMRDDGMLKKTGLLFALSFAVVLALFVNGLSLCFPALFLLTLFGPLTIFVRYDIDLRTDKEDAAQIPLLRGFWYSVLGFFVSVLGGIAIHGSWKIIFLIYPLIAVSGFLLFLIYRKKQDTKTQARVCLISSVVLFLVGMGIVYTVRDNNSIPWDMWLFYGGYFLAIFGLPRLLPRED